MKAAAEAAMTSAPRLLMAAWMTTFDRLKTAPCTPAGVPMERIWRRIPQSTFISWKEMWIALFVFFMR